MRKYDDQLQCNEKQSQNDFILTVSRVIVIFLFTMHYITKIKKIKTIKVIRLVTYIIYIYTMWEETACIGGVSFVLRLIT